MSKFNNVIELKLVLNEMLNADFRIMTVSLEGNFKFMRINNLDKVEYLDLDNEVVKLKIIKDVNGIKILDKLSSKVSNWVVNSKGFNQGFSTYCLEYVDNINDVDLTDVTFDGELKHFDWLEGVAHGVEIPRFIDWCCDNVGANSADFTLINNDKRLNLIYQEGTIVRKSFYKGERSTVTLSNADNFDNNFKGCPLIKLGYYSSNLSLLSRISSWEEIANKQGIAFQVNSKYLK